MSLDVFDNELTNYLQDKEWECLMCQEPIDTGKKFCSRNCANWYNED